VDPRRRREVVGVVGLRAVELAVPNDDPPCIEDLALVFGHGIAAARRRPGDALGEEPACTSRTSGSKEMARPFGADPVVALGVVGDLLDVVGKIGQLVDDEIRSERRDGVEESGGVEHVAGDGRGAEGVDPGGLVRRAGVGAEYSIEALTRTCTSPSNCLLTRGTTCGCRKGNPRPWAAVRPRRWNLAASAVT